MMGLIRALTGSIVVIVTVGFAMMNRQDVSVDWSPFHEPLSLPLFAICLGIGALGFLLGALVMWLNGGHVRREKRRQRKEIKALEKELGTLREDDQDFKPEAPAAELFPKLLQAGKKG